MSSAQAMLHLFCGKIASAKSTVVAKLAEALATMAQFRPVMKCPGTLDLQSLGAYVFVCTGGCVAVDMGSRERRDQPSETWTASGRRGRCDGRPAAAAPS